LFFLVSLNMWYFSIVSMYLPFFAVCITSMIFSIGPMEWLLSRRCVAKLDFLILYLKSWRCSLYLFWMSFLSAPHISYHNRGMWGCICRFFRSVFVGSSCLVWALVFRWRYYVPDGYINAICHFWNKLFIIVRTELIKYKKIYYILRFIKLYNIIFKMSF
jgi:hypothetical protein